MWLRFFSHILGDSLRAKSIFCTSVVYPAVELPCNAPELALATGRNRQRTSRPQCSSVWVGNIRAFFCILSRACPDIWNNVSVFETGQKMYLFEADVVSRNDSWGQPEQIPKLSVGTAFHTSVHWYMHFQYLTLFAPSAHRIPRGVGGWCAVRGELRVFAFSLVSASLVGGKTTGTMCGWTIREKRTRDGRWDQ